MTAPVVNATLRNIAEREQKVLALRSQIKNLPKKAPNRATLRAKLDQLITEIATLKASIHYYKATDTLAADIKRQQEKVQSLSSLFQSASGADKLAKGKELRAAAKELNQMLAAARMQQIRIGMKAPLPPGTKPNPQEGDDPAEFSLDQMPANSQELVAQFDEAFGDEGGGAWYTNKYLLGAIAIGGAYYLYQKQGKLL